MRIKEANDSMINLRAPSKLVEELDALAHEKRKSFSDYVRGILNSHIVKNRPKPREVQP